MKLRIRLGCVNAIFKDYYEPDEDHQEIPIENYVADIYRDGEIIETGNESKRWLEKIAMYLISIAVFFGAAYFLYPMLQYIFKF